MYFGSKEIETVNENIVTFKDGYTMEIVEKNKQLFTETPLSGSELQQKWSAIAAREIIDVLVSNNVRITDINFVMNLVSDIITGKNDEAIANAFGKEKLDTTACVFGANERIATLAVRNIQMKDIFKI